MTKPINIYILSRISDEISYYNVEKHASGKNNPKKTQIHEIISLRQLADALVDNGITTEALDGFFLGYQIPRIGKEFDLLKFTETRCLNIEIKSQSVPEKDILEQLKKNKHYLAHLKKDIEFYTVITDSLTSYKLSDDCKLQEIPFLEVVKAVVRFNETYLTQIDNMFRASDYLVSPFNTPDKFINGEYFLTQAQEQIKKSVLTDIDTIKHSGFYSITGKPGTGKTLLIYDLAKELSKNDKTAVIHCGTFSAGQKKLTEKINNFNIITTKFLSNNPDITNDYRYIFVDEAHRLFPRQFDELCDRIRKNRQICVFSSDPEQVLTTTEKQNDIFGKIIALPLLGQYELSEKIRSNRELTAFITSVMNLNKKPHFPISYDNVSLAYANSADEACKIIEYYKKQSYTFINYSKPKSKHNPYSKFEEGFDAHHVIGQEFDNVLMLMDRSFYYNSKNILKGVPHPNPDYLYPNLFYQGITRVREKLALIVVDSPNLFKKISSIIE